MNPKDIQSALEEIRASAGPRADVYASINTYGSKPPLGADLYPKGIVGKDGARISVNADDWTDLLDKLRKAWADHKDAHRAQQIKDMAIEIIRITADQGQCSDQALRAGKFSAVEVKDLGEEACAYATQIAANGPFTIIATRGANAA